MFFYWPDCFYSGWHRANPNVSGKLGMKLAILWNKWTLSLNSGVILNLTVGWDQPYTWLDVCYLGGYTIAIFHSFMISGSLNSILEDVTKSTTNRIKPIIEKMRVSLPASQHKWQKSSKYQITQCRLTRKGHRTISRIQLLKGNNQLSLKGELSRGDRGKMIHFFPAFMAGYIFLLWNV